MNWYLAKIIYQVVSGAGNHAPQFDEQYRLIKADELTWAWEKANVVGRCGETLFDNDQNENVQWRFMVVEDVVLIDAVEDGMQVYARTVEPVDCEEYIQLSKVRAQCLYLCRDQSKLIHA